MKMIAISAIILTAALLCGCATQSPRHVATDDEKCKSYGLSLGTPAYADCRLRLEQSWAQADAAATDMLLSNMMASKPVSCQRFGNYVSCN